MRDKLQQGLPVGFSTHLEITQHSGEVSGKTRRTRAKCLGSITASGNDILCTGALHDNFEMDSGNKGLVSA